MKCKNIKHGNNCKIINITNAFDEIILCPFCGFSVSPSNMGKWCGDCYIKYEIIKNECHFSKDIEKTTAECWAIALNKAGGLKIGNK